MECKDKGTQDIYDDKNTAQARRALPRELWRTTQRKMDWLKNAAKLTDARLPGWGLEKLKGDREGQHSIKINDQYRICFVWTEHGPQDVEIVDYH